MHLYRRQKAAEVYAGPAQGLWYRLYILSSKKQSQLNILVAPLRMHNGAYISIVDIYKLSSTKHIDRWELNLDEKDNA